MAAHPTVVVDGRTERVEPSVVRVATASDAAAAAAAAVQQRALAVVTDGAFATDVAAVTDPAGLPVLVTWEGGVTVPTTPATSTLLRIAPVTTDLTRRLADYLAGEGTARAAVGLVRDDSTAGRTGGAAAAAALAADGFPVTAATVTAPADAAAAVAAARAADVRTLVVWAQADVLAAVVRAARSSGWDVPVLSGPLAEDPALRTALADAPSDLDGLRFVSFRPTAEVGPAPFAAYRARFEKANGPWDVSGVTSGGKQVVSPPDWAMLSTDATTLLLTAVDRAKTVGPALLTTLVDGSLTIVGANGDQRGFSPSSRESVSSGDVYLAAFHDGVYASVTDDPLQDVIPTLPQTR